jgi:16S rRNA pseudouridine516 synthase
VKLRLDKLLADCGKGTRSQVKTYIKQGRVTVNGKTVKSGDAKVETDEDTVCFDDDEISFQENVYYMLNKPAGVVSATTDEREKTVIELITGDKPRDLFPVGRLDKDTEGLLLITNDGKLASSLLSPKKHVAKTYYARVVKDKRYGADGQTDVHTDNSAGILVDGILVTDDIVEHMQNGLDIGDEKPTAPARLNILRQNPGEAELEITITEGRYHQVKRMFQAVGLKVAYLKRLSMGSLVLDENLKPGEYRELSDNELKSLKESKNTLG